MAGDHGDADAGQLSRAWTRGHRERKIHQSSKSEWHEESVTGLWRMR